MVSASSSERNALAECVNVCVCFGGILSAVEFDGGTLLVDGVSIYADAGIT